MKMSADQRNSWMLTGATVVCVTALYVPCVQRTVPGGDSGGCYSLCMYICVYMGANQLPDAALVTWLCCVTRQPIRWLLVGVTFSCTAAAVCGATGIQV